MLRTLLRNEHGEKNVSRSIEHNTQTLSHSLRVPCFAHLCTPQNMGQIHHDTTPPQHTPVVKPTAPEETFKWEEYYKLTPGALPPVEVCSLAPPEQQSLAEVPMRYSFTGLFHSYFFDKQCSEDGILSNCHLCGKIYDENYSDVWTLWRHVRSHHQEASTALRIFRSHQRW